MSAVDTPIARPSPRERAKEGAFRIALISCLLVSVGIIVVLVIVWTACSFAVVMP